MFKSLITAYQIGCIIGSLLFGLVAFALGRRKVFLVFGYLSRRLLSYTFSGYSSLVFQARTSFFSSEDFLQVSGWEYIIQRRRRIHSNLLGSRWIPTPNVSRASQHWDRWHVAFGGISCGCPNSNHRRNTLLARTLSSRTNWNCLLVSAATQCPWKSSLAHKQTEASRST